MPKITATYTGVASLTITVDVDDPTDPEQVETALLNYFDENNMSALCIQCSGYTSNQFSEDSFSLELPENWEPELNENKAIKIEIDESESEDGD